MKSVVSDAMQRAEAAAGKGSAIGEKPEAGVTTPPADSATGEKSGKAGGKGGKGGKNGKADPPHKRKCIHCQKLFECTKHAPTATECLECFRNPPTSATSSGSNNAAAIGSQEPDVIRERLDGTDNFLSIMVRK